MHVLFKTIMTNTIIQDDLQHDKFIYCYSIYFCQTQYFLVLKLKKNIHKFYLLYSLGFYEHMKKKAIYLNDSLELCNKKLPAIQGFFRKRERREIYSAENLNSV